MVKPDQLIKRRGKLGLIKVNIGLNEVQHWVDQRFNQDVQVIIYSLQGVSFNHSFNEIEYFI